MLRASWGCICQQLSFVCCLPNQPGTPRETQDARELRCVQQNCLTSLPPFSLLLCCCCNSLFGLIRYFCGCTTPSKKRAHPSAKQLRGDRSIVVRPCVHVSMCPFFVPMLFLSLPFGLSLSMMLCLHRNISVISVVDVSIQSYRSSFTRPEPS